MIQVNNPIAECYYPSGEEDDGLIGQTTHLGIGAHQDDLEMLAIPGILAGYEHSDQAFTGVTVTDGRGAPRSGDYADLSDEEMWQVRLSEQRHAADIGRYLAQFQLNYGSAQVKSPQREEVITDLMSIIQACQPKIIYTHNLADKHDTHVAVSLSVIEALRRMGEDAQGITVYGSELWRGLDWLLDDQKVTLDVSSHPEWQAALLQAFTSQISGGKRYDLAAMGRKRANATYYQSHHTDQAELMVYAMDLTPLITDPRRSIEGFMDETIQSLAKDVHDRLQRLGG
ncbi:MAG: PIG-L family deacetylase [Anaerolineaceae bacterium]|nr:PIG-L family deacetylase [Anaerolineaceae bacterium]